MDRLAYWSEVWERKGRSESTDLLELNGFEATTIDPAEVCRRITDLLALRPDERLLEVGCGAGMLARHLVCDYVGLDYSRSLVRKHIRLLGHSVLHGAADDLPLKDKSVDKVLVYSVFHYFPDKVYARQVIAELERVARKAVFIGDLPFASHRGGEHLLYEQEEFAGWKVTPGFYNDQRFNAHRFLEG